MTVRHSSPEARRGGPLVWGVLAIAVLVALVLLVLTLIDWATEDPEPAGTQLGVTAGEVVDNPDEYRDEVIMVSGEVNQVLGPLAYTIGGEFFAGGQELLIIGPPPAVGDEPQFEDETVREQDIVQVSGTVRDFDLEAIEEEIEAEIEAEIPHGLQEQPLLLSEGTVITPRVQTGFGDIVDAEDVLNDPEGYAGEVVTVLGDITEVIDENAFVVGDGLLVLDTTDAITEQALTEAESMEASGQVVRHDAGTIDENVNVEIDHEQIAGYEGDPVLIAETILLLPEAEN